jgi:hypothetical protein
VVTATDATLLNDAAAIYTVAAGRIIPQENDSNREKEVESEGKTPELAF